MGRHEIREGTAGNTISELPSRASQNIPMAIRTINKGNVLDKKVTWSERGTYCKLVLFKLY